MLFAWLKARRRARVVAAPFPEQWISYLQQNVGLYALLSEAERKKLHDDLRVFLDETTFEGCGGLVITDEIRVTIAAQAALLLLGFRSDYYERVHTVLVYPSGFRSPDGWEGPDGVVRLDVGILGQAWHGGTVILAWDSVLAGGRNARDGQNVVLHEFAHQLDYLDGVADGTPPLRDLAQYRRWHEVMTAEYNQLVSEAEHGNPKVLDAYGATNPAEFFAVATECFFEKPVKMRARHPQLYEVLKDYYCQDTASRVAGEKAQPLARKRQPYRGSRKPVRSAARPAITLDWPGWVTIWGIEPSWQRSRALSYLDKHLLPIVAFSVLVPLSYFALGKLTAGMALLLCLVVLMIVTAIWLRLAIWWVDRHQGWAEQQAAKTAALKQAPARGEAAKKEEVPS